MKKFKILIFIIIGLMISLTFSSCGWLVPYAMQPSYHEFKQMCELNLLPNNKEKYNKILNYFNLSLETLDWKELNKKGFKLKENSIRYVPHKVEYQVTVTRRETSRYYIAVILFANEKGFSLENLSRIMVFGDWYTRRYHLEPKSVARSFELEWREDDLTCGELVGYMKEEENE